MKINAPALIRRILLDRILIRVEALIEAHRQPQAAVGPLIANANRGSMVR